MTPLELDEIMIHHWPGVLRRAMAQGDDWTKTFARSIARAYKRPGWMPSARQERAMRRCLREMHTPDDTPDHLAEVCDDSAA